MNGPETDFSFNFIWNDEECWVGYNEAFGFCTVIRRKSRNRKWKAEYVYDSVAEMRRDIGGFKHGELPGFLETLAWEKVLQDEIKDIYFKFR